MNYEERLYAVGKIPGGFIKREGRPSEKAILASRLIDRPIRPIFPDGFRNDVQVYQYCYECRSGLFFRNGGNVWFFISTIVLQIFHLMVRLLVLLLAVVDGEFVINPTVEQTEKSDIHLTVAGNKRCD